MRNERERIPVGRRAFAKSVAAGVSMGGLPGFARASSSETPDERFKSRIEQSHEVKRRGGSVTEWHRQLRAAGFEVGHRTPARGMASKQTIDPNAGKTERDGLLEQDDVDVDLTLVTAADTDLYYAELSWSYDLQKHSGTSPQPDVGRKPEDVAALSYNNNWWRLAEEDVLQSTSTSAYVEYADDSYKGCGPAFKVDDDTLATPGAMDRTSWCGVFLKPVGEYGADERRIYGEYVHTWATVDLTKLVSAAVEWPPTPNFVIIAEPKVKTWHTSTRADGDTLLRVHQSDAVSISTASDGGLIDGDVRLTPGDVVRTTRQTNVRSENRFGNNVRFQVPAGYTAKLVDGPTVSDEGVIWWSLECTPDGQTEPVLGWVRNDHLELHKRITPPFEHGDRVTTVNVDGGQIIHRSTLGWSHEDIALPEGIYGFVRGGPESHEGSTWWYVYFWWVEKQREDDMPRGRGGLRGVGSGWVKEKYLTSDPGRFADKDRVQTTSPDGQSDVVGLRNHPDYSDDVDETISTDGRVGYVQDGPYRNNSADWYEVDFNVGSHGWLPGNYLEKAPYDDNRGDLTDLDGYKFESEIRSLVEEGVVSGYSDDTFRPNRTLTRAEFVTMVNQAFDLHPGTKADFTDVDGHWAESHIRTVGATHFISGYRDGSFRPDREITKAEVITSLASGLHYSGGNPHKLSSVYHDADKIPTWARQAFADAHYTWGGIESVPDDEYLEPNAKATRGGAAKYVYDALHN